MCSFNCVPSLLLIGVKDLRCVACFFVRTLFHCFVCALVADPRIGRTLVVSFDILRRLRLVTALSLRSYKTNVSGCGGLIAFLPIIKRLIPLTESHLVGVIIFNSIQLSLVSDIDMYQRHLIPDYQEVSPINRVTPGLIIFRLLILWPQSHCQLSLLSMIVIHGLHIIHIICFETYAAKICFLVISCRENYLWVIYRWTNVKRCGKLIFPSNCTFGHHQH